MAFTESAQFSSMNNHALCTKLCVRPGGVHTDPAFQECIILVHVHRSYSKSSKLLFAWTRVLPGVHCLTLLWRSGFSLQRAKWLHEEVVPLSGCNWGNFCASIMPLIKRRAGAPCMQSCFKALPSNWDVNSVLNFPESPDVWGKVSGLFKKTNSGLVDFVKATLIQHLIFLRA